MAPPITTSLDPRLIDSSTPTSDEEYSWAVSPPSETKGTYESTNQAPPLRYRRKAQTSSSKSVDDDLEDTSVDEREPRNYYPWLISNDDKAKDITIHCDLEISVDLTHDLESLARLNRLGHFKQAITLFETRLASHLDFFPVVAEHADLLLEQGAFGNLEQFVSDVLLDPPVEFAPDELHLLKVLQSLAQYHTRGALIPALRATTSALPFLNKPRFLGKSPTGIQIQLVEACVRIIVYAIKQSNFLNRLPSFRSLKDWVDSAVLLDSTNDNQTTKPKASIPGNQHPPKRFRISDWHCALVEEGFFWESHRLLRAVLPICGDADGLYTPRGWFEAFAQIDTISEAVDIFLGFSDDSVGDEQRLLTEFANASLLAEFLPPDSTREPVCKAHTQFQKRAQSLALTISSTCPHLVNSRPYLNWLLSECAPQPQADNTLSNRLQDLRTKPSWVPPRANAKKATRKPQPHGYLQTISASAQELGDYHLQTSVLQNLSQQCRDINERLQAIQDLARLCHETMQDAPGYLQSMVDEYLLLASANCDADKGRDLHRRLLEFEQSFPYSYDHDGTPLGGLSIVFFDIPLSEWMERKTKYRVLQMLDRTVEAQLTKGKLYDVEDHRLPVQILHQLGFLDLDHSDGATANKIENQDPEPKDLKHVPLSILPKNHHSKAGVTDDELQAVEDLIQELRQKRALLEKEEPKRRANFELCLEEEEDKNQLAESEKTRIITVRPRAMKDDIQAIREREPEYIILRIPVERNFILPFNQCQNLEAVEGLLKRTFSQDAILGLYLENGNYEFAGPDGDRISREEWTEVVRPGGTVVMNVKSSAEQSSSPIQDKQNLDVNNLAQTDQQTREDDIPNSDHVEKAEPQKDIQPSVEDAKTQSDPTSDQIP
ncbi:hypothetical protein BO78DRAFT_384385 [Aspergillus sclerotiicarbonarius CBS 121057]|uniref:Ubiquitin-like domain-containing protein n=1 Tax=Aspergillus sclerotiicarbonarius (strain CBS 121057 / IBT 28362) TaxID=1448318 RepID=A0A319EXL8_ASPSB|nr:hypothetical protein BO78DRAFT_384385 [Aspergillus sclerotiicarbonarius CBS 121057]